MTTTAVAATAATTPAVYDEATLAALAGYATPADAVSKQAPDVLKINYDEDAEHPRGSWVLGQRKDKDGAITDQGVPVSQIVILAVRYRYTAYCESLGEYISTMIFANGERPADLAEKKALAVQQGCELRFQTVLYGLALVDDGMREFVSYLSGSSYTAVRDLVQELTRHPKTGKANVFPVFSHIVRLEQPERKKFQANTYFVPVFKLGKMITREQVDYFAQARDRAVEYVAYVNEQTQSSDAVATAVAKPVYEPPKPAVSVSGLKSANVYTPPDTEDDVPLAPGEDEYDIEAAVKAVLGRKKTASSAYSEEEIPF